MSAAKECRYGCKTLISWDNSSKSFKEQDGTPHTRERCESLKKKVETPSNSNNRKQDIPTTSQSGAMTQISYARIQLGSLTVPDIPNLDHALQGFHYVTSRKDGKLTIHFMADVCNECLEGKCDHK